MHSSTECWRWQKSWVERNQLQLFLSWPALMTRGAIWRQSWSGTKRDHVGEQPSPVLWALRPTYFLKGHKIWYAVLLNTSSEGKDLVFIIILSTFCCSIWHFYRSSDMITHKNMAKGSGGTEMFVVTRRENVRQISALQPAAISFPALPFSALLLLLFAFTYT